MANFHGRYELKYFLPFDLIDKAIAFASPYVQPDQHAKPNGLGVPGYTIRSVYFDDDNLTLYKEKLIGLKDRRKFRVRGYANVTPENSVFLEIKYRSRQQVGKDRAPMKLSDLQKIMDREKTLEEIEFPTDYLRANAHRFLHNCFVKGYRPMTTVIYDRNPFIGKDDGEVRFTIDTNLRAVDHSYSYELFEPYEEEQIALPGAILELKFDRLMPEWMRRFLTKFELTQTSISKYAHCIEKVVLREEES